MSWDHELSSILSGAEGSVSKMRERLTSAGNLPGPAARLFPATERIPDSDSVPPALPLRASPLRIPAPPLGVQWSDLAAIQSQLQIQSQAIESLTQKVHEGERERHFQHRLIQALQEEVQELRERESRREPPGALRTMEQWRREVGRELSSLRGHISRVTLLGNPEESFSAKLCREELELLSREVDQLKTHLSRQQQEEGGGARSKILEELIEKNTTLSADLLKIISQCSHTQHQLDQIRTCVSELRDVVKRLVIKEHQTSGRKACPPCTRRRCLSPASSLDNESRQEDRAIDQMVHPDAPNSHRRTHTLLVAPECTTNSKESACGPAGGSSLHERRETAGGTKTISILRLVPDLGCHEIDNTLERVFVLFGESLFQKSRTQPKSSDPDLQGEPLSIMSCL
uniref:uncharacterized protein LOC120823680 isoform X2 n=1 Tax=Gasterosteus aculeatus aculeatus TaxID=481459 RepID=UPI001A98DD19|nr:uncharacterized protein LOC120823680 isoform X2 [Gasterosteus aculeatus aculeatus]